MNLIKSTSTYSFFVLTSRILGYFRDVLIAIYLGSGPIADAFFVAFRIPNTFRRLFSEGTFNSAFVPSFMSELNKGKENAKKFDDEVRTKMKATMKALSNEICSEKKLDHHLKFQIFQIRKTKHCSLYPPTNEAENTSIQFHLRIPPAIRMPPLLGIDF